MRKSIGEKLSPILKEMADTILEYDVNVGFKPNYEKDALEDATIIFMSVFMDKIWELQEKEKISMDDRCNMVTKAGEDFRKLIKTFTGIDTHKF